MRTFVTGDKHGNFKSTDDYFRLRDYCVGFNLNKDDVVIILGDHGIHYDEGVHDKTSKAMLAEFPVTFVMIRGNHDMRPRQEWERVNIDKENLKGRFWKDPDCNNILYTDEYGWYKFGGKDVFVISGAYSVDKYYRLNMKLQGYTNFRWFPDEQLTEKEREDAGKMLLDHEGPFSIMSHTCPIRYTPREQFIAAVDQSSVDNSMEIWLDDLLSEVWNKHMDLQRWYCGHWHTDKVDDIMLFMYHDILEV